MVETLTSLCAIALVLSVVDGKPTTTSLDIARHFNRPHDEVLRRIRNLLANLPASYLCNFAETETERPSPLNGAPIKSPAYRITRDGFTLLAMGFTGKKALQFKLAYIDAFNKMEAQLQQPASQIQGDVKALQSVSNLHQTARNMGGFAAAVGMQVQMVVLDMMAQGKTIAQVDQSLQHHRWMVYFDHTGKAFAKEVPQDASVVSPSQLGQMLLQGGPNAPFTADEVATIAWHATWRMHREATDLQRAGHLEQLRKQVQALPAHELADIAREAWFNLGVANPIPTHLAKTTTTQTQRATA